MLRRLSMLGVVAAIGVSGFVGTPAASAHCTVNVGNCAGHCTVNVGNCGSGATCTVNVGSCTRPPAILCNILVADVCGALNGN